MKLQRSVDTPKISKQQTSKLSDSDALKHCVGRSDSTASGDSHKVWIVSLPQKPTAEVAEPEAAEAEDRTESLCVRP